MFFYFQNLIQKALSWDVAILACIHHIDRYYGAYADSLQFYDAKEQTLAALGPSSRNIPLVPLVKAPFLIDSFVAS